MRNGNPPLRAVEDALARRAGIDDDNRGRLRRVSCLQLTLQYQWVRRHWKHHQPVGQPLACVIGLVTSPAVKLSPNAMKRVRDRRAAPGVGAVGPLLSPQPVTAIHASARIKNARCIQTENHISVAHPWAERTYSSTFLASTSSGTFPPRTTVSLNALRSNFAPRAVVALWRRRLISLWPIL